jgi:hypothetical protein
MQPIKRSLLPVLRFERLGLIRFALTLPRELSKPRAIIGNDDHGVYVTGSEPVKVPNARLHQIPKVIAEHHGENARRELQRALIIGKH